MTLRGRIVRWRFCPRDRSWHEVEEHGVDDRTVETCGAGAKEYVP